MSQAAKLTNTHCLTKGSQLWPAFTHTRTMALLMRAKIRVIGEQDTQTKFESIVYKSNGDHKFFVRFFKRKQPERKRLVLKLFITFRRSCHH